MVHMRNFLFLLFHHQKFEDIACGLFELGAAQFNQTQAVSLNFDDEKGKIKHFYMFRGPSVVIASRGSCTNDACPSHQSRKFQLPNVFSQVVMGHNPDSDFKDSSLLANFTNSEQSRKVPLY